MERTEVESSTIQSIGFEDGWLEIEFRNGGIYRYENVGMVTYQKLLDADSKGKFFHNYVKDNYPTWKRVDSAAREVEPTVHLG